MDSARIPCRRPTQTAVGRVVESQAIGRSPITSPAMRLGLLWILAAIAGALGALVLFDAQPGLNWGIWTIVTLAGLLVYRRPDRQTMKGIALPAGFAVVLALGAAVTSTGILLAAILAIVASLMALTVLLASDQGTALGSGPVATITARAKYSSSPTSIRNGRFVHSPARCAERSRPCS